MLPLFLLGTPMLLRIKLEMSDLVNEILDQIPHDILIHGRILDPAAGGGQFLREIERRKRAAGLTDKQISDTLIGVVEHEMTRNYIINQWGVKSTILVGDALKMNWKKMKFSVVVGNPPFSDKAGNIHNRSGKPLYPQFFKLALKMADHVAMIMPITNQHVMKGKVHNDLLRQHANVIKKIDPWMFPNINIPMWYVICDKTNPNHDTGISWVSQMKNNDVPWCRGMIPNTDHDDKPKRNDDIKIYYKINATFGLVTKYQRRDNVRPNHIFPDKGYALLMPQTFNDSGWSKTAIVKCEGNQAAFRTMNIVFFKTKKEAIEFDQFMKTPAFISEANKVKYGFNKIDRGSLRAMKITWPTTS